ncbi:peptidylprolyl isomerase A [Acinetobacter sp. ANC 4558]|uniref:peptidylprolyl isomerase n=1 Tax=Acinetobacter sp. ANC 4558 TaxID=1977876 RepID=UPI000A342A01|nr:peptidylprolyl isomerase [Acinetobacter sp. ANC 4558]OTG79766.1 peptidylprolyl isomerase A [Acinetobacter sp. ANC 4558]
MLKNTVLMAVVATVISSNLYAENTQILMETNMGPIEIELFNDKAPISTKNFEQYVKSNFYNGTIFHRVISGFMIQAGGFNEQMIEKSTRFPIQNESYNALSNERGTLAMARTNIPDSAKSQFFINLVDNPHLNKTTVNDGYAVFGKVTKGMDVVDKIAMVSTSQYAMHQNVPEKPVLITNMQIKKIK